MPREDGQFKKGQVANPTGRPKGSTDKISTNVRGMLADIMEGQTKRVMKALKGLDDKDFIDSYAKLIGYVIPKMKEVDHKTQDKPNYDFSGKSLKEVREFIEHVESFRSTDPGKGTPLS